MIAFVHGKLFSKTAGTALIDCGGVGYAVIVSMKTYDKLPETGSDVFLFTYFAVREDAQVLYGFSDQNELELFRLLISVNGVGPKSAIGILSAVSSEDLIRFLSEGNTAKLTKLPGIGKKTAERLVLELKEKLKSIKINSEIIPSANIDSSDTMLADEAVNALISLGYKENAATRAVSVSMADFALLSNKSIENLIKLALKNAMK